MAIVEIQLTLVDVVTGQSVSLPSRIAGTIKASTGVGARCVGAAIVSLKRALINVRATQVAVGIALVPGFTAAVHRINRGAIVTASGIRAAIIKRSVAIVDVGATRAIALPSLVACTAKTANGVAAAGIRIAAGRFQGAFINVRAVARFTRPRVSVEAMAFVGAHRVGTGRGFVTGIGLQAFVNVFTGVLFT